MNAHVNPYGAPWIQWHHTRHMRLYPLREHLVTRNTWFRNLALKNVNFALCYTVHLQKWMRTWTPTVSHDSSGTTLTMWGCSHFENTSSQETHIFENSPTKMLTLYYVIRCIFANECARELPTASHDSIDAMLPVWGSAHFENTSSQET